MKSAIRLGVLIITALLVSPLPARAVKVKKLVHEDAAVRAKAIEDAQRLDPEARAKLVHSLLEIVEERKSDPERTYVPGEGFVSVSEDVDGPPARAIEALGRLGSASKVAIPVLITILNEAQSIVDEHWRKENDPNNPYRGSGNRGLYIYNDLKKSAAIRAKAAEALGTIGPEAESAIPTLFQMATRTTDGCVARLGAVSALRKLGATAVPHLISELKSEDPERRAEAATLLGDLAEAATPAKSELIRVTLDQREGVFIRHRAARALRNLKDADAAKAIAGYEKVVLPWLKTEEGESEARYIQARDAAMMGDTSTLETLAGEGFDARNPHDKYELRCR